MSNHVARPGAPKRSSNRLLHYGVPLLAIITIPVGFVVRDKWIGTDKSRPSYPAQVLDSRITHIGYLESYYGGKIIYRIEVHASWTENGSRLDAWMPTTTTSSDELSLKFLLSQSGSKFCTVRRNPHNSHLVADLNDDWTPLHSTSAKTGK
ncbi:MAG TPA: hypothetical protein VHX60_15305 [Acidobacteriaceae bacterium]|jgi:hypothetical protein|nr:hypothetical protein [Acidobacteriaceae bacterium]